MTRHGWRFVAKVVALLIGVVLLGLYAETTIARFAVRHP